MPWCGACKVSRVDLDFKVVVQLLSQGIHSRAWWCAIPTLRTYRLFADADVRIRFGIDLDALDPNGAPRSVKR